MAKEKEPIRRAVISETTRNIDNIAKALNEGRPADKELIIKLINRMLAFLDATIKPKKEEPIVEALRQEAETVLKEVKDVPEIPAT
jgi:hypothetical protein